MLATVLLIQYIVRLIDLTNMNKCARMFVYVSFLYIKLKQGSFWLQSLPPYSFIKSTNFLFYELRQCSICGQLPFTFNFIVSSLFRIPSVSFKFSFVSFEAFFECVSFGLYRITACDINRFIAWEFHQFCCFWFVINMDLKLFIGFYVLFLLSINDKSNLNIVHLRISYL